MNLLINLSNQPMEELDVIKRWCTLLQETQQCLMRLPKKLRDTLTQTFRGLAVLMVELVYRNVDVFEENYDSLISTAT